MGRFKIERKSRTLSKFNIRHCFYAVMFVFCVFIVHRVWRMISINRIVTLDIDNYKLLSNCENKCKNTDELDIMFLIISYVHGVNSRAAVRATWGKDDPLPDLKVRYVFITGLDHNNQTTRTQIIEENRQFGDMVIADLQDNYLNLPRKILIGLDWVRKVCPKSVFYVVSADDVYISVRNMVNYLKNEISYDNKRKYDGQFSDMDMDGRIIPPELEQQFKLRYFGTVMFSHAPPVFRDESELIFPPHEYKQLVNTHTMVMSRRAVDDLSEVAPYTAYFKEESDVYFRILAARAGYVPNPMPGFYRSAPDVNNPDLYDRVLSVHHIQPQDLTAIFNIQRAKGNA